MRTAQMQYHFSIDGNEANVEKRVGVSMYTHELLKYFHKKAGKHLSFTVYLRKKPLPDLPQENRYFRYKTIKSPFLFRDVFLPISLYREKKKSGIFFSPAHYTPRFCPMPTVVTIHDLSYLYFPQEFLKKDLYKLNHWTNHAITNAKTIITVSLHTKKDIIKHFQVNEKNIKVIYNGFNTPDTKYEAQNSKSSDNFKFNIFHSQFILYVGTLQPRKNINTLIEAFHLLLKNKQYKNYKLVIAGKKGWMYEKIFTRVKELELEKQVIFTGYVSQDILIQLYQNARAFVMPSLYEGFGIPILEAMSHGCPVVSAKGSSLEEISGDACLYFDPKDAVQLKNSIEKILDDTDLKNELIKKGKKRVKKFSWQKCGRETLDVLMDIANHSDEQA